MSGSRLNAKVLRRLLDLHLLMLCVCFSVADKKAGI